MRYQELQLPEERIATVRDALVTPDPVPRPVKPDPLEVDDPDDAWVVTTAFVGGADVLVTGDAALLAAAPRAPLPIVSPRGFWSSLREARVQVIDSRPAESVWATSCRQA